MHPEIPVEEVSEQPAVEAEPTVEETAEKAPKAKKKKSASKFAECPDTEKKAPEFDTTTGETVRTRTEGSEVVEFSSEDNTKEEKDTQEAMNKENNKTKDFEDGVKSITDHTPEKEEEDKGEKIINDNDKKDTPELDSKTENVQDNHEHKEQENASDMELDDLVNTTVPEVKPEEPTTETSTEEKATEVTTTSEDETPASGEATIEDIVDVEIVEEPEKVEVVVPEKVQPQEVVPAAPVEIPAEKTTAPVAVSAVNGYTATVGSTISFIISGDDVSISGLDGISYSFDGSNLTVNVGNEATVLTVVASNSISNVEFDIMVNA